MSAGPRILYVDATAGAAGDMILGALVDLGVPLARIREAIARLPIDSWTLSSRSREVHGIRARKVRVGTSESRDEAAPHRTWRDVRRIVRAGGLSPAAESRALAIFRRLFEAEAAVHGMAFDRVHLHEAGAVDALIDVVGACVALERIAPDRIVVSPLTPGHGTVRCRHGLYPVPAPATQRLLVGVPTTGFDADGERLTPTGAAVLTAIADAWGPPPAMTVERIGHGAGDRDFPDRPNLVRMVLGRGPEAEVAGGSAPTVVVLECTVDDATPQALAYACERALAAGALDAWVAPVVMKKGRAGHLVTVLARPDDREAMIDVVLRETTTLGVRWRTEARVELDREWSEVRTPHGRVRIKVGRRDGRELQAWPEYEDCAEAARASGATLREVQHAALAAHRERTASAARGGRRRSPKRRGGR